MPEDELKTLLPEIHQAVVNPAPSGIMFANDEHPELIDIQ